jgi:hypothetical protein
MQQDSASLSDSRKRCGACLFELDPQTKSLSFDADYDLERVFKSFGIYEINYKHLEYSSSRGCEKCKGLITFFKQCKLSFNTAQWCRAYGRIGPRPRLMLDNSSTQLELCVSLNEFEEDMFSVHPSICTGNRVVGHTGGDKALDQAAAWLTRCRNEHEECRQGKNKGFAPTRLLFIGGKEEGTIYLIENPSSVENYAALSHRWTEETGLTRLEGSNLFERKSKGIPLSKFSHMMQDTVFVVRRLGILYLWIDSMCIIQDDSADWRREAARMGSIYANAEITIAATWWDQSGKSLFCNRSEDEYAAFNIGNFDGQPIFLRRTLPHFTWRNFTGESFSGDAFWNPEKEWPLLNRGWVYQEQLLSHRMLHFTRHELLWECNSTTGCECGWYRFDDGEWGGLIGGRKAKHRVSEKAWNEILLEYSMREFTFPIDRLSALAGVAKAFGDIKDLEDEKSHGKYVSGMRTEELDMTLFWYSNEPASARPNLQVPTWSWASVTGKVQFVIQEHIDDCVKILDTHIVYYGDPYMGEVEEGRLLISGPVVPAAFYHGQSWLDVLSSAPTQPEMGSSLTSINEWPNELNKNPYGLVVKDKFVTFIPDYRLDNFEKDNIASGSEVFCLCFSREKIIIKDPEEKEVVTICCLVLYCVDKEKSYYQRIGYFEGWARGNLLEADWAMSLSQTRELTLV